MLTVEVPTGLPDLLGFLPSPPPHPPINNKPVAFDLEYFGNSLRSTDELWSGSASQDLVVGLCVSRPLSCWRKHLPELCEFLFRLRVRLEPLHFEISRHKDDS